MKEIKAGMYVKNLESVEEEYPGLKRQTGVVYRIIAPEESPNFVPDRATVRLEKGLINIRLQDLKLTEKFGTK